MSTPAITGFLFDDDNEEKVARHRLTPRRLLQVLENEHIVALNKKGRRGRYLVIGRDHGGAAITIVVEATHDPALWRPVTAWPSEKHEAARLR